MTVDTRPASTAAVITEFLEAARSAAIQGCTAWADDVTLDATVPDWRFHRHGAEAVREVYCRWFSAPGEFRELTRDPVADGEVVRYLISSTDDGVAYVAHHVHRITVRDGRITSDIVFCGGRWTAERQSAMSAEDRRDAGRA